MKKDFVWSNGDIEIHASTFADGFCVWQDQGRTGKLWERRFSHDGVLEGVTDVTPISMAQVRRLDHLTKKRG